MKELKFTSFLMAIALSFLTYNPSYAQTSADCQTNVNISLGTGCTSAIPYEAFNSWRPSCMVIEQDGMKMAAIAGSGSFSTGKLDCFMQIDSVYLDTIVQRKINYHFVPMWKLSCDINTPDTIYADLSKLPALCKADTSYSYTYAGTAIPLNGLVVVNSKDVPECSPHSNSVANDGKLIFTDTVETVTYKQNVKKVMRVDTFSHTEPLRWVKGTIILNINGTDSIVHGVDVAEGKKVVVTCGTPPSLTTTLGGTVLPGPNVLQPGKYIYNSYTPDSSNFCWGNLNIEYKLWPKIDSRKDTISCVDVTQFDRSPEGGHYDYHAVTSEKLVDVCKWAEEIGALRSIGTVTSLVNSQVRHCYQHTITTKDRYIKDFNWLCDTVVKERSFLADHPDHRGGIKVDVLVKDTLMIVPITLSDVSFPDSLVVMKCGILEGDTPDEIAEYLYKAYEHFGNKNTDIIVGLNNGGASGYLEQKPCDAFASQYAKYNLVANTDKGVTNDELWKKVFQGADYNNWGVKKAFPYVVRRNKLVDKGLRTKMNSLVLAGDVIKADSFTYEVDSVLIPINKIVCNIAASKIDLHPINPCGGEKKIFREWTIVDWCTGTIQQKTQIIKIVDAEAPTITGYDGESAKDYFGDHKKKIFDGSEVYVRTEKVINPWGCIVRHQFPDLGLKEHCTVGQYEFELISADGISSGLKYPAGSSVDLSWNHDNGFEYPIVKVYLWDECGNDGEAYYYLTAVDKLPPVVVVHDQLNVTLSAEHTGESNEEGIAKIFCEDVDAGSHDGDCGEIHDCKVRIKGTTEWLDAVHFDCDDVGEQIVEFMAEDYSGNTSIGWTNVVVENKLSVALVCEDVTIGCTDPIHPDWLGYPHVFGICNTPELEWSDESQVDDLCFKGVIKRTWVVVGSDPRVTCVQTITIDDTDNGGDDSKFDPRSIRFPLHHTGQTLKQSGFNPDWIAVRQADQHDICRESVPSDSQKESILEGCRMNDAFECEPGEVDEPTWTDPDCGLVGKTYEDQIVEFGGSGNCFKILRTWAIVDWCEYDPKAGNEHKDEVEFVKDYCDETSYFRLRHHTKVDGYYAYTQEIKVLDDTPPAVIAEDKTVEIAEGGKVDGEPCVGEMVVSALASDFCASNIVNFQNNAGLSWVAQVVEVDDEGREIGSLTTVQNIDISADGTESTASFVLEGAAGTHYRVKWTAIDDCNNRGSATQHVWFKDVKAPVLVCIANLSTSTMNTDGSTEIWAADFSEAFDCDGEDVDVWFKDKVGSYVPALTFTCDNLDGKTDSTFQLRVYASDSEGNEAFCEVTLRIIDSSDACGNEDNSGAALIAGEVRTELGDMIESAEISLALNTRMTSVDGQFAFDDTPMGQNYQMYAKKSDDYMNGVSTLDLVLIQKHILGLEGLNSPYKIIAADINNDEKVSAIDLVELRKLILGIIAELPNNDAWRFADASYSFDDINDPFPFVELIDLQYVTENRIDEDFIGIKVGDVSGNAIANSLIASGRHNEAITLKSVDSRVSTGETIRLEITSDEFVDMNALQFTMSLSGLEYQAIEPGVLAMTEDHIANFGDRITAAWYDVNTVSSDDVLFTLVLKALEETTLSNAISIGSSITDAEAYKSNNEGVSLTLAFETKNGWVDGSTFELYQNQPNPFNEITTIGFQLGEAGSARMTVFDVTGKIITTMQGQYARGYNEITISKSDLSTSGVLYYQLESGSYTATRKMILID